MFYENKYDNAIDKCQNVLNLASIYKKNYYLAQGYSLLGFCFYTTNNYKNAVYNYEESLIYFNKEEDIWHKCTNDIIKVNNSLGALYNKLGDYDNAIKVLMESLKIAEQNGVKNSTVYNNVASYYLSQDELKKSLDFQRKAIEIEKDSEMPSLKQITRYLINTATLYIKLEKLDEAEKIYHQSIEICFQNQDFEFLIGIQKGLANLYILKGDFNNAENSIENAIYLSEKHNLNFKRIELLLFLSDIFGYTNSSHQLLTLNKALEESLSNSKVSYIEILEKINEYYIKEKNYEKALEILTSAYNERIQNYKKEKESNYIQFQQKFENEFKDLTIKKEKEFNEKLKLKNKELQNANDDLQQANKALRILQLHIKSMQLSLNSHFIFNSLQSIQAYIYDNEATIAADYLAKFAKLMRAILNASQKSFHPLEDELKLLDLYLSLEQERFKKSFVYQIRTNNLVQNNPHLKVPVLLLQPFIENAIKHGINHRQNGKIDIYLSGENTQLLITIKDNGSGIANTIIKKNDGIHALDIINKRMHEYDQNEPLSFTYSIKNGHDIGTEVCIVVNQEEIIKNVAYA